MSEHFRSRKVSPRKQLEEDLTSFPPHCGESHNDDLDEELQKENEHHQASRRGVVAESRLAKKKLLAVLAAVLCLIGFLSQHDGYDWFHQPPNNVQELLFMSMESSTNETLNTIISSDFHPVAKTLEGERPYQDSVSQSSQHDPPSWTSGSWELSTSFPTISDESQEKLISDVCSARETIAPLHDNYLSTKNKNATWTLCMTITAGFYDFFRNWYMHYQKLGLNNLDMVLFAEDPIAFQRLSNAPFLNKEYTMVVNASFAPPTTKLPSNMTTNATSSTLAAQDQVFDVFTNQYFELISNRPSRLLQVLCSGRNVLYIDTDTVLKKDPLPEINKHYRNGADFSIAIEHSKSKGYAQGFEVCTGFMAIKANPKTINFLSEWEQKCHNEDGTPENDQIAFNRAYEAMWTKKQNQNKKEEHVPLPRVERLRSKLFPNGFQYFDLYNERQREKVVLAHANWIIGGEKKKENFQDHGLWLLPDDDDKTKP